jgi:acyl dehydratase
MKYSLVIDNNLVLAFAELSGDFNAIHIDEAAARKTRFGQRIAHGPVPLTVVVGSVFRGRWPTGREMTVKYVAPVAIGDEVSWTPNDITPNKGEIVNSAGQVAILFEIEGALPENG